MSLEDKFKTVVARQGFDTWFESQTIEDREIYLQYAADPRITHGAFLSIVKDAGAATSWNTVEGWRKGHGFPTS